MKFALALFAVLPIPSIALAQDPRRPPPPPPPEPTALVIVPRVSVLYAELNGKITADEGTVAPAILDGTSIHFDSDLGLDDPEPALVLEIAMFRRIGERYFQRASFSYLDASYEGASTLDSPENFNGRTLAAGTSVDSEVHYRSWGADAAVYSSDAIFENTSGSFLLGARYVDMQVEIDGGGRDSDERLHLFYFGGGFRGETQFVPGLTGMLQASVYFSAGGFDDSGDFEFEEWGGILFEGMAGLGGSIGMLQLEAGWRYLSNSSYNLEDSDDKFEDNDFVFELNGPYASATLRF